MHLTRVNSLRTIYKSKKCLVVPIKKFGTQKRNQSSFAKKVSHIINHPAGPKTIFFWAPLVKWGLVIAGLADLSRHPSTVSLKQALALTVTGSIWSRYSLVIIPKNWFLFSVNFFVAFTQGIQVIRVYFYRRSLPLEKTE